jgi:hypothetical protein
MKELKKIYIRATQRYISEDGNFSYNTSFVYGTVSFTAYFYN